MSDADLVDALCDVGGGLSAREVDFVDDLGRRLHQMRKQGNEALFKLTERQRSWAEAIWARVGDSSASSTTSSDDSDN